MPVKYKQFVELLYKNNTKTFEQFREIHDGYVEDPEKWADEFHSFGRKAMDAARDWERRLCSGSERGKFAKFSAKLAEKYWEEIEKDWPKIREVGLKRKVS